jgi:hypothetical protein
MRLGRFGVVLVVGALLMAGGLIDRVRSSGSTQSDAAVQAARMPSAAPASAISSTWYCVGTVGAPGFAGTVVVANTQDREARGTVAVSSTQGGPRVAPITVAPRATANLPLPEVGQGAFLAAVVDLDVGRSVAELVISGLGDLEVTPCASSASERWYFPDGSTARDAGLSLSLFNPFPEDAIVDLSFSTDQGRAAPGDFQGIVVPAQSLVVKDIGEHVRRREAIFTSVNVRTGRLVAAQAQVRTAPGRAGLSVLLGTPSPSRTWYFPDGAAADGLVERYTIANPGSREATVLLEVNLDEGAAEPFEITVPAGGQLPVVLNQEPRIPKGTGHSATVRSLNDEPVVVTRTVEGGPPSTRVGRTDMSGARRGVVGWAFAAGGASDQMDEWITVQNPGAAAATVSFIGLSDGRVVPLDRLQAVRIEAGRRLAVRLRDHLQQASLPVIVTSDVPVVAERAVYVRGRGLSSVIGTALG